MDLAHPANAGVLRHLTRSGADHPPLAAHHSVARAYEACGCHPDIVERLWDKLAPALPGECRFLVYHRPALVHPETGLVFALGFGTRYALRLPELQADEARRQGAVTIARWSDGRVTDLAEELGAHWSFGNWAANEAAWLRTAYFPAPT